jgi:CPA2 family monovalent cation:H+ antiporter-2
MELVADLTLIILAALIGGFIAQRLGQPLIVGYILAGVLVSPATPGPSVSNVHDIEQLAELGVALLLFALGLELSFRELTPVKSVALIGGALQIVLTIALGAALGLAFGWPWPRALWFGAFVSLSSTMVVLKTLQGQGRLGTLSARVMLGILIVQDLAVVPLMIILPELSDPAGGAIKVVVAAGRAVVLLGVIVLFSTRVVPRLMSWVARWNSRELFFLSVIALAVGVGYTAFYFGLSLALGAFVAGLVVNESEYAHQALSDVVPLRDLFGMLFFASVGMLLDPALIAEQIGSLAIVVLVIALGKAAILSTIVRLFGYWNIVPLAVGLTLFQVGEFAFVLVRVGLSNGAITEEVYSLTLNTAIVTMALTPVVSSAVPFLYSKFWPARDRETHEAANLPASGLNDHVVVTGAGRVGRSVVDALSHLGLPFVLIDSDDRRVEHARTAGLPIIYGDASQPIVLEAAGVLHARAVLITVPAFADVSSIARTVRQLRPDMPIIARADGTEAVRALYALGIQEVTSPEFEASIEMTRQAMMYFNVPAHDVLRVAGEIRRQRYEVSEIQHATGMSLMAQIGDMARHLEFVWLGVPPGSPFDARTLASLKLRTTMGVSIVGIIRDGTLTANPDGDAELHAGDLVAVLGTRDPVTKFSSALRGGPAQ